MVTTKYRGEKLTVNVNMWNDGDTDAVTFYGQTLGAPGGSIVVKVKLTGSDVNNNGFAAIDVVSDNFNLTTADSSANKKAIVFSGNNKAEYNVPADPTNDGGNNRVGKYDVDVRAYYKDPAGNTFKIFDIMDGAGAGAGLVVVKYGFEATTSLTVS